MPIGQFRAMPQPGAMPQPLRGTVPRRGAMPQPDRGLSGILAQDAISPTSATPLGQWSPPNWTNVPVPDYTPLNPYPGVGDMGYFGNMRSIWPQLVAQGRAPAIQARLKAMGKENLISLWGGQLTPTGQI